MAKKKTQQVELSRASVNKILFEDLLEQRALVKAGSYKDKATDINSRQIVIANLFNLKNDLRQDVATVINIKNSSDRIADETAKQELLQLTK